MLIVFAVALLASPPPASPAVVVGKLTEQAALSCAPDGTERWGPTHLEVGFIRLLTPPSAAAAQIGRIVVVAGEARAKPLRQPVMPCQPMQMRGDWVYGPRGMRVRRTTQPFPAFAAHAVRPFTGLSAVTGPAEIAITVTNPLGRPLEKLTLTMAYEGCYGKPMVVDAVRTVAALAPDESRTVTFPRLVERAGTGRGVDHAAAALVITGQGSAVTFDLQASLPDMGAAAVQCPERRRRPLSPPPTTR